MEPEEEASFDERVRRLPRLGLGLSTEFGAHVRGVELERVRRELAGLVSFLEIGADLERGIDDDARAWVRAGLPTTYHFLDQNLEEAEDQDERWVADTRALAREVGAAWVCGDAGLWHVGPRERGHGMLLPPVLVRDSARAMADNVRALRGRLGFEVLPENPPAHVYLGDLHLLEYFAEVVLRADSGMLLDVAHLAVYQRATGREPLDGLADFPLERVVEAHVAGGRPFEHQGRVFVDDDHGTEVLEDTWTILAALLPRAPNLRAVVFECERNPFEDVRAAFEHLREACAGTPVAAPSHPAAPAADARRFASASAEAHGRAGPGQSGAARA